jgi:hypothetical protein
MLLRASDARHRAQQVSLAHPGAASLYGETPEQAAALAGDRGLVCEYRAEGKASRAVQPIGGNF